VARSVRPPGRNHGWLLWLAIHIVYLMGFSNRLVVLVRWAWSFLTHGRGSRLITGTPLLPPIAEPEPPATTPPPEGPPPPIADEPTRRRRPSRSR